MSTDSFRRNPLIISGNSLSTGDRSTTFSTGRPESLLRSYLILVRDLRGQRREPSIELRTEDVHVIAAHLGVSDQLVLGGLLDLMGATRAQRTAMSAMLAAGALTLILTGSVVNDLSTDGVSVEMGRLADVIQAAVHSDRGSDRPTPTGDATTTARRATPATIGSAPTADALRSAAAASHTSAAANRTEPAATTSATAPDADELVSVAPPTPARAPAPTDEPVATAELPDGTTVGVAAPPVPPPPTDEPVATAELPDGTTVGIIAPPVPAAPPEG